MNRQFYVYVGPCIRCAATMTLRQAFAFRDDYGSDSQFSVIVSGFETDCYFLLPKEGLLSLHRTTTFSCVPGAFSPVFDVNPERELHQWHEQIPYLPVLTPLKGVLVWAIVPYFS